MDRLVEQLSSEFLPAGDVNHAAAGSRRSSDARRPSARAGSEQIGRARIVLACAQCGGRNYRRTKARREGSSQLALSKFCSTCNAHTLHREAV
jgi:large subunit ribosomal protein L33